jgi:hypothetical protein
MRPGLSRPFAFDGPGAHPGEVNHFAEKDSRQINILERNIDHDHIRSFRSEVMNVIEILGWRGIERKTGIHFS